MRTYTLLEALPLLMFAAIGIAITVSTIRAEIKRYRSKK